MATLDLSAQALKKLIGWKIGCGRDDNLWTTAQTNNVQAAFDSGMRSFYFPDNGHNWTFLRPYTTLSVTTGNRTFPLASDFAGMESQFTWPAGSGCSFRTITVVDKSYFDRIMQSNTQVTSNGKPTMCAVYILATGGPTTQQVVFDRPFDADYSLTYRYRARPLQPSTSGIPLGGEEHGETMVAACLAAAEWQIQNTRGVDFQKYQERLQASMRIDQANEPTRIGPYGQNGVVSAFRSPDSLAPIYNPGSGGQFDTGFDIGSGGQFD